MDSKITSKSIAINMITGVSAILPISVKVVADIFISIFIRVIIIRHIHALWHNRHIDFF